MSDENPPAVVGTPDNIQWTFLKTLADYTKMTKCWHENNCTSDARREKSYRIRNYCANKPRRQCKFMLLAMKTTKQGYHVFKHGEHNHPVAKCKSM